MRIPSLFPSITVALALCFAPTACSIFQSREPTPVAQGKYFASGHPEYDEFFLDLYRAQVSMAATPERWASATNGLADGLGLNRDLPRDAMIEHARARARELSTAGRIMKLQLNQADGDKSATALLLTRPVTRDGALRGLAEPVEKSSNELLSLQTDLEAHSARFAALDARLQQLEARAERDFAHDLSKSLEVERNLDDAGKVLAYMREQADTQLKQTTHLLEGLAQAMDTSDGAFNRPEPEPEPEPAKVAQPAAKTPTRTRKSAAPAPKPAPARKAAPARKPAPAPKASEPAGFEP